MIITTNTRIVVNRTGGPEVLELVDAPMPVAATGQVVIRIEAVGVAFADIVMRLGLYPGVRIPFTPGYEVVGTVVAGDGIAPGTRVAALTVTGGYARFAAVAAADCVPVPAALSSPQAAALVLNGLTAFQMLTRCVARPAVERMLVWGAAGGVGSMLLELGRHFGIATFGIASGKRLDRVAAHGATPIDRDGDVLDQVMRLSGGGVDAVFDGVGGTASATSFAALRSGGQAVLFGFQGGLSGGTRNPLRLARAFLGSPRKSAQAIFMSNRGWRGYTITEWKATHPDFYRADLAEVFALAAAGKITPVVDRELPLADAVTAHHLMAAGTNLGKIVLIP